MAFMAFERNAENNETLRNKMIKSKKYEQGHYDEKRSYFHF